MTRAGGAAGFMTILPLKALVIKSTLLLAMGPLTVVGALLGWAAGRAMWKRHSRKQERQLQHIFGESVALAAAGPRALPPAPADGDERICAALKFGRDVHRPGSFAAVRSPRRYRARPGRMLDRRAP